MDYTKAVLVICITLFIVIGINAAIYISITRRKGGSSTLGQIELLRRAAKRAQDPWQTEHTDLQELSRRVSGLKQDSSRDPDRGSESKH
ncbi:MAG TPA: hypothetical protein VF498_05020 [Anaerolineales bacterium]